MATGGRYLNTADGKENYGWLKFILKPDGTIERLVPVQTHRPHARPVFSKDVIVNMTNKTWFRMFRPAETPQLPVIFCFVGGAFIFDGPATTVWHNQAEQLAKELPAIVISIAFRLAPENRLPAAYDDGIEAICWVRDNHSNEPYLRDYADFSRCFVMGSDSGGNIAYHVGSRAHAMGAELAPLTISGVVIDQALFGGTERTELEQKMAEDEIIPYRATDLTWQLVLPEGADKEHEFCNPLAHEGEGPLPPRCLIRAWRGDPLSERLELIGKMLERLGVPVTLRFRDDGFHCIELFDRRRAQVIIRDVKEFVLSAES